MCLLELFKGGEMGFGLLVHFWLDPLPMIWDLNAGRVRIQEGASLRIDQLRAEDQGWYECRVLFLDRPSSDDEFQNGTWIHLTVNGRVITGVPTLVFLTCLFQLVPMVCGKRGRKQAWLRFGQLFAVWTAH